MARRLITATLALLALALLALQPVRAAGASDAEALVGRVHAGALAIAHGSASAAEVAALRASFDAPYIAQRVLGQYWQSASAADRNAFVDALVDAIIDALAKRLGRYSSQSFAVLSTRTLGGGDFLVRSRVTPAAGDATTLDWRLHGCGSGLCITDLYVNGASVSVDRREEVERRLGVEGGTLADLTAALRENLSEALR
jgi:phospholipid transport system substrate-binding protein